jgi:hypothetical protein
MLTSEGETCIVTHMDHVHITQIFIIVLIIVYPMDKSAIFHMSK